MLKANKRLTGEVKSSALIGREGVGAIVEEGSLSYVVAPLDWWTVSGADLTFPTPARVLALLGKSELRRFSFTYDNDARRRTDGMVPYAVRFPRAVVCMSCDQLYVGGPESQELHCSSCKGEGRRSNLFGANWIMVCHRGHADDFWWSGLAHRNDLHTATGIRANCTSNLALFLTSRVKWANSLRKKKMGDNITAALEDTPKGGRNMYTNQVIGCLECGASSDLSSLRNVETGVRRCRSMDPWGQDTNSMRIESHCAWPILRSSTQIIQVSGASFLDIDDGDGIHANRPLDSGLLTGWMQVAQNDPLSVGYREQVLRKADPAERLRLSNLFAASELKRLIWLNTPPSLEELGRWMRGESGETVANLPVTMETGGNTQAGFLAEEDYRSRMDEWKVLSSGNAHRPTLVIEQREVPRGIGVSGLSAVGRFREIRVPLGYTRVHATRPPSAGHVCELPATCGEQGLRRGVADEIVPWLPAHEVFGEGIYIGLDPVVVRSIVTSDAYSAKHLDGGAALAENPLTVNRLDLKMLAAPAFALAHTFSHLLIKELAFVAGYSLPSLRERIYVSDDEMRAGILIYTADGDSEGSMGGLVRLAQGELIASLVRRLVARGSWCPQDPICWESSQSGALGLNRSACHGCTIIPETSCAHSNLRLDRRSIVDPDFGLQRWINAPGGRRG